MAVGTHRSAVEESSAHEAAERAFAASLVRRLEIIDPAEPLRDLILAAPPRMLANLRHALPPALRAIVRCELNKDLTKHSLFEIERQLAGPVQLL